MAKSETKKALKAWMEFTELCKLLFSGGDDCPYLINELKSGKWAKMARALAKEMEIDWKKMTTSESNAIMLAMLEDTYQQVRQDCEKNYVVKFDVIEKEKPEPAPESENENKAPADEAEKPESDENEAGE